MNGGLPIEWTSVVLVARDRKDVGYVRVNPQSIIAVDDLVRRLGAENLRLSREAACGAAYAKANDTGKCMPPVAEVTETGDYGATVRWLLNPMPIGSLLYETPASPAAKAVEMDADKLHAAIMNLPCISPLASGENATAERYYKIGHRDARHQAADLVSAAMSAQGGKG